MLPFFKKNVRRDSRSKHLPCISVGPGSRKRYQWQVYAFKRLPSVSNANCCRRGGTGRIVVQPEANAFGSASSRGDCPGKFVWLKLDGIVFSGGALKQQHAHDDNREIRQIRENLRATKFTEASGLSALNFRVVDEATSRVWSRCKHRTRGLVHYGQP